MTAPVFTRTKLLQDVIAQGALEGMQVGARKMPARCGRASSEHGTSDRQDVQSSRAARWTTAVEIGAYASFEQASVQHSRSPRMSRGPSGNATVCRSGYPLAVQYCSISETCFRFFLAICFPKKRTARLSPAVQVREETPRGKGSDGGGEWPSRILFCKSKDPAH